MKMRLGLAACGLLLVTTASPLLAQPRPVAPQPAGDTIQAEDQSEMQWAAAVASLKDLKRQGQGTVHFFGTVSGDPAMNGHQLFLSFFLSPAEGHRIFRIGDFLDYRVVSESPGRVVLAVRENTIDDRTTRIGVRNRRINLSWTNVRGEEAPASLRITSTP